MKKKILFGFSVFMLFPSFLFAAPTGKASPTAPAKIVFGQVMHLSGPMSAGAKFLDIPVADLWFKETNAKGGLYVPQYDKRIPIELIRYDDKSDIATTIKLYEKLITVDKVDLLLPPHGSAWQVAISPINNKYKFPWVTFTGVSEKLYSMASGLPYSFNSWWSTSVPGKALVELCKELGVKTVAMFYVSHEFGIDYVATSAPYFAPEGIDVVLLKSYPMSPTDLSPLINKAKAAKVDAMIAYSYVAGTFLFTEQSKVLGFNPKLLYVALAAAWPAYRDKFGADVVEGVMGPGGWSPELCPEAQEFYDKFRAMHGRDPCYWSTAYGYACFQVLEQAIAKAGFEDREALRDVIASETFTTAIGPVKFENQYNIHHSYLHGQWQNGDFKCVSPVKTRRAKPIYPKPPWPKK